MRLTAQTNSAFPNYIVRETSCLLTPAVLTAASERRSMSPCAGSPPLSGLACPQQGAAERDPNPTSPMSKAMSFQHCSLTPSAPSFVAVATPLQMNQSQSCCHHLGWVREAAAGTQLDAWDALPTRWPLKTQAPDLQLATKNDPSP